MLSDVAVYIYADHPPSVIQTLSASVDADNKHSPVKTHIRMYCFCLALRTIHLNNGGGCLFCFVPFYTYVRMCIRIYPPILPAIERVGQHYKLDPSGGHRRSYPMVSRSQALPERLFRVTRGADNYGRDSLN